MLPDTGNMIFQLALQFVNQTGRTVFLTGKAGTGKTTFLKYIKENSFKKMAVVAPTGVAAINAGGVTMHSFFQLPFGPYIPVQQRGWNQEEPSYADPNSLFKNIRFTANKRELLQELELLVIDEISMVRADTLDAVDTILRHFRQQPLVPFGGVQLLYIGDLFQLPPVVSRDEWDLLQQHYKSPFFFDAKVIHESPPIYLELNKIYRQNEVAFINILNNIRNNLATPEDLEQLHSYYDPEFIPPKGSGYITLTTHNARADGINQAELAQVKGKTHTFEASVTGEFNDKSYPAEKILNLKEGAQVMLIKNDKGEARRYFNGKIGTIKKLSQEKITIAFPEEPDELILEKETWKNIRYNYDKEKDRIEEEELGTFSQYPLRLAWAITIHKSQGLTFEKAVIDAGASFAAGQVYVALSRLTSLEGLILRSRIQPWCIHTDPRVIGFTESRLNENALAGELRNEQLVYIRHSLVQTFQWTRLTDLLHNNLEEFAHRQIPDRIRSLELARQWRDGAVRQQETAVRFTRQLEQLLPVAAQDGYVQLQQRVQAAADYFGHALDEELIQPLQQHIQQFRAKQKAKKYVKSLQEIKAVLVRKRRQLEDAAQTVTGLLEGKDTTDLLTDLQEKMKDFITARQQEKQKEESLNEGSEVSSAGPGGASAAKAKPQKGDSHRTTLQMYKEGISIAGIASRRGLAQTTVESHLASFIPTGEISLTDLVAEAKIPVITSAIEETGGTALGPIKSKLGDNYTFGEIRAVMNFLRHASDKEQSSPAP